MADVKIKLDPKILADEEIPAAREQQGDGKSLAGVEISAFGKIPAFGEIPAAIEKLVEPEKQAACLGSTEISSCLLLPGLADEHVQILVDVMNLACSLQVRNDPLVRSFYGRTLSRTVPAVCTGPPCQEMAQINTATKSLAFA